ncbi:SDR family oxidoreductase [Vitiosangium sp. GDMCC 1.1324]|uniref:SDR family oxidoreductase n=1 Tax=Vitiosangium sp. (strain GDMCC 1.1324) TaxID=2138576 RepID=UPI000D39B814|nr:SDR family oxidoreductase [Vitiosangium sp. GDMCC 1.1324]PTL85592.1 short chain dehydrogenase [Vitiosangium sp. GDMCC 1.1324]
MSTQRIFITGGASGLGRAIALRFARAGWRVCIADVNDARGAETLASLTPLTSQSHYLRCDVTREEDLRAASEWLSAQWGGVDVVVNNAGVAQAGAIDEVSLSDWQWVLDINLLGVVRGCKVFTPVFKRQGRGHFVNVASMAGLLDMPKMSSYNASKAAVVSLSETLQNELVDDNIGVSVVCPSFFKTNLAESLRTTDPGLRTAVGKLLERSPVTAEDIADQIFQAVKQRDFYVLPHREARHTWLLKRLLPRELYASLIQKRTRRIRGRPEASRA